MPRAVVEDSLTVEEARKIDRAIRCQKICVETVHEDGSEDENENENEEGLAEDDEGWEGEGEGEGEGDDGDNPEREEDEDFDAGRGDAIVRSGDGCGAGTNDYREYNDHVLECRNCHRRRPDLDTLLSTVPHELELGPYEVSDLVAWFWRLKFACFTQTAVRTSPNITLCRECALILVGPVVDQRGRGLADKWPAFIWKLLTNEKLNEEVGTRV
jgi:hypothetical protein